MNAKDLLAGAESAMREEEFDKALQLLASLLHKSPYHENALLLQGRCLLALDRQEESAITYRFIVDGPQEFSAAAKGEASLALGDERRALALLIGRNKSPENFLLAAVAVYRLGRIPDCIDYLQKSVRTGWEWADDNPISPLVQYLLTRPEFLDFEQIYLDAGENVLQSGAAGRNRWFALNMPIYELYTATTADKQQKRAAALVELMSPGEPLLSDASRENLELILRDFAASQTDASFGLESLIKLQAGEYAQLAKDVLALQLEHLGQFAEMLGLAPEDMPASRLQQLIPRLPQRLATCLMVLYAISGSEDRVLQQMQADLDAKLTAHLVLVAFKGFYQEVDRIHSHTSRVTADPGAKA